MNIVNNILGKQKLQRREMRRVGERQADLIYEKFKGQIVSYNDIVNEYTALREDKTGFWSHRTNYDFASSDVSKIVLQPLKRENKLIKLKKELYQFV